MAKFYICVGPPLSGKSTWARKMANKNRDVIRINRDDLRTMFRGGYVHGHGFTETLCTITTISTAGNALRAGYDVILDNTNCTLSTVNDVLNSIVTLKGQGIPIEVEFKVFEIPYWKQRWRNFWRWAKGKGPWIPSEVSKRMDHNFHTVKKFIDEYTRGQLSGGNT